MRIATVSLRSESPYGQSKYIDPIKVPKLNKETSEDYEERVWRERGHYDDDGHMLIPAMAFKNCLQEAAKFLGEQIPGRGKERYTKHFESGVMVLEGLSLPVTRETIQGERVFVPADGRVGGSKRVMKNFPYVPSWEGQIQFYILDDAITKDVFEKTLREAGRFIGIGYWRPNRRGMWGRFAVAKVEWRNHIVTLDEAA